MKPIRERFGEEYSEAAYKAWAKADIYDPPLIRVEHKPEENMYVIGNDDIENNQAVHELNNLLGLSEEPVDKEAIRNIDMERMKKLKLAEFTED